ncbi:MAG: ketoacyl-ACP synthase III [Saprospiraceae bacterium]|nr:ketoacyl-ACP synthase III [Saprospiraceae bacterium]
MKRIIAGITGVNGWVPDYVLTNAELETMVDTNDEWIRTRTGVEERRILKGEGLASSHMGQKAVEGLLEKTGTSPDEIDLIIVATVTPDMIFPDTANIIADKIGAKNCFGFDIHAACSGFLFALTTGAKFVESGTAKKVIVIGVDMMSSIVDYTDRSTCIIFGDAAGAVLLEPQEKYGLLDSVHHGDGSGRDFLHMRAGGSLRPASLETIKNKEHYIFQEGRTVFKAAVNGMCNSVDEVLERNNLSKNDIDWIVPHQANIRIINSVANHLDFPKDKVMINIQKYGNTTAATLPLCLWDYEDKLKPGDKLVLTAFGGGFTWGATYLTWAY